MRNDDLKQRLQHIFAEVFENPAADEAVISKHFAKNYMQYVDGKTVDYAHFVKHIAAQKAVIASAKVTFAHMLQEGNKVSTVHIVNAVKKDGSKVKGKVVALFEFDDQGEKLILCDELTHMMEGSEEDKDLGSRH